MQDSNVFVDRLIQVASQLLLFQRISWINSQSFGKLFLFKKGKFGGGCKGNAYRQPGGLGSWGAGGALERVGGRIFVEAMARDSQQRNQWTSDIHTLGKVPPRISSTKCQIWWKEEYGCLRPGASWA